MIRYFSSGILCLAAGLAASGSMAQQQDGRPSDTRNSVSEVRNPFATQDNLGDHIAREVLNMNGHHITNLRDPFYQGDAVNLGYLERNTGWNRITGKDKESGNGHIATGNLDFGGFDVILDGSTLHGGTLEATALSYPEINGGSLSGISMRNSAIEVPHVTGGTFNAPVLLGPVMNKAILTDSEMTGSRFMGSISESIISESTLLDMTVTGTISVQGGRITGLPDPVDDDDAMSRKATGKLVNNRMAVLTQVIEGLEEDISGLGETLILLMEDMETIKDIPVLNQPDIPDLTEIRIGMAGLQGLVDGMDGMKNDPAALSGDLPEMTKFDIEAARSDLIITSRSDIEAIIGELGIVIETLSGPNKSRFMALADIGERIEALGDIVDILGESHLVMHVRHESGIGVILSNAALGALADFRDWNEQLKGALDDMLLLAEKNSVPDPSMVGDLSMVDPLVALSFSILARPEEKQVSGTEIEELSERLSEIENRIAGLDRIAGNLRIDGDLDVAGIITGAQAQVRPTPTRENAKGVLDGGDVLVALHEMDTIVYSLSEGKYAIGIDPDTIPAGMDFIVQKGKGGDESDSIDYAQMIGPLVATIRHMDERIRALESEGRVTEQIESRATEQPERTELE